jgi:hypothetical protein
MTGWEASARPAWDLKGEAGENTQAFSAPDIPESTVDQWPKPSAPPPDIFQRDYGQWDPGQRGLEQCDLGQPNSPRSELGRLVQPGQPGRLGDSGQPSRRATGAFSAAVSATGGWAVSRQGRRSLTVGAVLAVIALAIAGVEFLQGSHSNSSAQTSPNTISTATGGATPGASPKASATHKPTVKKTGYLLTTSANAGGYPLLATVPSYAQGLANSTAQTVRGSVVSNGGTVTGKVAAAYQLSNGQVLAFTGYKGTFTPAKVIAGLGANARTYPAGRDGGSLACFTASGGEPGTVCVWATTTTAGIAEFFSSAGPETVTIQSKAAADTVKLRDSVEHR